MNSSMDTPSTLFGNASGNAFGNAPIMNIPNMMNYNTPVCPQATYHFDNGQQPAPLTQSPAMSDPTYPSICIPRTHHSVTWKLVKDAFEEIFGGGCIEQVDVVKRTHPNGQNSCKVFIHFNAWPDTSYAQGIRQQIIDGNTIKVVYQFPWYWKCMMSHSPKRRWNGPAPYIQRLETAAASAGADDIGTPNNADTTGNNDHVGFDETLVDNHSMDHKMDVSNQILECMEEGYQLPDGRIVGGAGFSDPVPGKF